MASLAKGVIDSAFRGGALAMIEPFEFARHRPEAEMGSGVQAILALVLICLFSGVTWLLLAS
jgi:hypothetical protein